MSLKIKFLGVPDYFNETDEQYFPGLLLIYIALSRTTPSLRADCPFGEVLKGRARATSERKRECEGRRVFLNVRQAFMAGQEDHQSKCFVWAKQK